MKIPSIADLLVGALKKFKPDFNKDGKDDLEQLAQAVNKVVAEVQHAIETLDYPTLLVHLTDIAESMQFILGRIEAIKSAVTTEEVQSALKSMADAVAVLGGLLKSFAATQKVAILEQNDKDIA